MMKVEVIRMLKLSENNIRISFRTGCLLMATLSIARGSSFLFSKHLLGSMEPLNLLGARFLLAFLILFVLFSRKVITDIKANPRMLYASLLLGGVYFLCMAADGRCTGIFRHSRRNAHYHGNHPAKCSPARG